MTDQIYTETMLIWLAKAIDESRRQNGGRADRASVLKRFNREFKKEKIGLTKGKLARIYMDYGGKKGEKGNQDGFVKRYLSKPEPGAQLSPSEPAVPTSLPEPIPAEPELPAADMVPEPERGFEPVSTPLIQPKSPEESKPMKTLVTHISGSVDSIIAAALVQWENSQTGDFPIGHRAFAFAAAQVNHQVADGDLSQMIDADIVEKRIGRFGGTKAFLVQMLRLDVGETRNLILIENIEKSEDARIEFQQAL